MSHKNICSNPPVEGQFDDASEDESGSVTLQFHALNQHPETVSDHSNLNALSDRLQAHVVSDPVKESQDQPLEVDEQALEVNVQTLKEDEEVWEEEQRKAQEEQEDFDYEGN